MLSMTDVMYVYYECIRSSLSLLTSHNILNRTLSISEVVHNQVKIGYQLVQYIRESEANL